MKYFHSLFDQQVGWLVGSSVCTSQLCSPRLSDPSHYNALLPHPPLHLITPCQSLTHLSLISLTNHPHTCADHIIFTCCPFTQPYLSPSPNPNPILVGDHIIFSCCLHIAISIAVATFFAWSSLVVFVLPFMEKFCGLVGVFIMYTVAAAISGKRLLCWIALVI